MAFRSALCMLTVALAAADEFLQPRRALEDCDVCEQGVYTGYNHKDSESPQGQRLVWVGGSNGQWSLCAEQCQEDLQCQGWTYVYDGSPGASSFKCWLKFHLWSTDYTQWKKEDNDISGLRNAR